jgi:hypothetical protein
METYWAKTSKAAGEPNGYMMKCDRHKKLTLQLSTAFICTLVTSSANGLPTNSNKDNLQKTQSIAIGSIDLDWMLQHIEESKLKLSQLNNLLDEKVSLANKTYHEKEGQNPSKEELSSLKEKLWTDLEILKRDIRHEKTAIKEQLKEKLCKVLKNSSLGMPVFYSEGILAGCTTDMSEKALALLNAQEPAKPESSTTEAADFRLIHSTLIYDGLKEEKSRKLELSQHQKNLDDLRMWNKFKLLNAFLKGLKSEELNSLQEKCKEKEINDLIEESDLAQAISIEFDQSKRKALPAVRDKALYVVDGPISPMPMKCLDQEMIENINSQTKTSQAMSDESTQQATSNNPLKIDKIDLSKLRQIDDFCRLNNTQQSKLLKEVVEAELLQRSDSIAVDSCDLPYGGTDITDSIVQKMIPKAAMLKKE